MSPRNRWQRYFWTPETTDSGRWATNIYFAATLIHKEIILFFLKQLHDNHNLASRIRAAPHTTKQQAKHITYVGIRPANHTPSQPLGLFPLRFTHRDPSHYITHPLRSIVVNYCTQNITKPRYTVKNTTPLSPAPGPICVVNAHTPSFSTHTLTGMDLFFGKNRFNLA